MAFTPDQYAFPSTGDPEKDAQIARDILRTQALESEGLCPNGCAPIIWDTQYEAHCPTCGFIRHTNAPYGGGVAP